MQVQTKAVTKTLPCTAPPPPPPQPSPRNPALPTTPTPAHQPLHPPFLLERPPPPGHHEEDVGWWQPQEVNIPTELTFPGAAMAMRQLFHKELWDYFLGPNWFETEVIRPE